ncbi:hypothetical protein GQ600_17528 [Phytophthora cactorum]|nr:hypothetical protein GQ600_17528 [Phytophthora cactorum]
MDTILPVLPTATDSTLKHTKAQSVLKKRSTILIDTSEALFTTECIVVASYLEAMFPYSTATICLNGASPECPVPHGDGWVTVKMWAPLLFWC